MSHSAEALPCQSAAVHLPALRLPVWRMQEDGGGGSTGTVPLCTGSNGLCPLDCQCDAGTKCLEESGHPGLTGTCVVSVTGQAQDWGPQLHYA